MVYLELCNITIIGLPNEEAEHREIHLLKRTINCPKLIERQMIKNTKDLYENKVEHCNE